MPNLEELKQRNRLESQASTNTEQTLTLPYLPLVSAIPTDQWNMMLESQTAAIQRLQELAAYISTLPTVDDVNKMMKNYYQNVYDMQTDHLSNTIRKEHQRIMENMTSNMEKTTDTIGWKLTNTLNHWEEKLRHRDMSPLKMKGKWAGIGGVDFNDIVALAKAVDDLVNPYNPEKEREKKKKYVPKGNHKKQKKKHHNYSHDYDLSL